MLIDYFLLYLRLLLFHVDMLTTLLMLPVCWPTPMSLTTIENVAKAILCHHWRVRAEQPTETLRERRGDREYETERKGGGGRREKDQPHAYRPWKIKQNFHFRHST